VKACKQTSMRQSAFTSRFSSHASADAWHVGSCDVRSMVTGAAVSVVTCLSWSCGASVKQEVVDTGPLLIEEPQLECIEGENEFNPPVAYDTDPPGAATAEEALRPSLEAAAASRKGEIDRLSADQYGVVVDGRIVTIAKAAEIRPGEWHLVDHSYCE